MQDRIWIYENFWALGARPPLLRSFHLLNSFVQMLTMLNINLPGNRHKDICDGYFGVRHKRALFTGMGGEDIHKRVNFTDYFEWDRHKRVYLTDIVL